MVDESGYFGTPIQWACAAIGGVLGFLFSDHIARSMGLAPSGKGWWNATKYWAVRAAVTVGGAAIGYLVGTGIMKLALMFFQANPAAMFQLSAKLGPSAFMKIMNIFGINPVSLATTKSLFMGIVGSILNTTGTVMSLPIVQTIIQKAKDFGIAVSYHAGHAGTNWTGPHIHVGNHHINIAKDAIEWVRRVLGG